MFRKVLLSGVPAQKKFINGIQVVDTFVGGTYGPGGRNRLLQQKYKAPWIVNDGANIARRIVLEDPIEDMAAQTLIEVSMQTADQVGDGTTTAVIIGAKLATENITRLIEEAGHDDALQGGSEKVTAMSLLKDIQAEEEKAQTILKEMSKELKGKDLDNVIATSLENHEYGTELANLLKTIGADGYISVEDNWATKYGITTEVTKGMRFLGKYASGYLATEKNKKEALWEETHVLVTNERLESTAVIKELVDELRKAGKRKLVIINGYSEGVDGYSRQFVEAISVAVATSTKPGSDNTMILAVKAPSLTTDELTDVACFCNSKFFDTKLGQSIKSAKLSDLGYASKVSVTEDEVNVVGGVGKTDERIEVLKEQAEREKDQMFKEKILRRVASLSAGVGVIRVGANTETERSYIKEKLNDAVSAAKAAMQEGIVPGGGLALKAVAEKLGPDSILYKPLMAPHDRICKNAGWSEVKADIKIVDPLKVVRLALKNACSGAGMLITADAAIGEEKLTYGDFLEKAMRKVAPYDERDDWRDDENQDQGVPGYRN